ncbi:nicotinate-nucleotide adenylyltransferase [Thermosyntropha lipolytica DSM 11003]|uniref:Probable nicotinate-nucleotide adenylyltransferase n=1 Tax=Thermosyntropha lipolytica DSM 11003 TaxID=1123382 RepID=A0A1M5R2T1_9FIRM|nr:nicotinate-nucleotide adenylyltransferase [Thermosyntropha lipolytica]SHH20674.1 nicotinate-nucleotide adenylyltransferase [Thermosyntropha lipolytica DSM 11003]
MVFLSALGIMGGTFDPVHIGHLLAAEWVRSEFNMDKVVFIPAASPPHKDEGDMTPIEHRYRMVELAIQDNPYFEISPVEKERKGKSYTVDTIAYFRERYPDKDLYFIMGTDSLLSFPTWKKPELLVTLCSFVVVSRPGYVIPASFWEKEGLLPLLQPKLYILEMPGMDISSSEIRERIKQGKSVKYLLPREVEEYIYKHSLYRRSYDV